MSRCDKCKEKCKKECICAKKIKVKDITVTNSLVLPILPTQIPIQGSLFFNSVTKSLVFSDGVNQTPLYPGPVGTGDRNTGFGSNVLQENTTGRVNSGFGESVLSKNTTGSFNTAIGSEALSFNTTGTSNTASGSGSLYQNTTGYDNSGFGGESLLVNTTGHTNTAHGNNSLRSNTIGNYNTGVGNGALLDNVDGSFNTAIGVAAGPSTSSLSNTVCVGVLAKALADGDFVLASAANPVNISSSVGLAGTAQPLPLTPETYLSIRINDIYYKIPCYLP